MADLVRTLARLDEDTRVAVFGEITSASQRQQSPVDRWEQAGKVPRRAGSCMSKHTHHIPFGRIQARRRSFGIPLGQAPRKVHARIDAGARSFGVTGPREDPVVRRETEVPAALDEVASRPPARDEAADESGQEEQESLHLGECRGATRELDGWREVGNGKRVGWCRAEMERCCGARNRWCRILDVSISKWLGGRMMGVRCREGRDSISKRGDRSCFVQALEAVGCSFVMIDASCLPSPCHSTMRPAQERAARGATGWSGKENAHHGHFIRAASLLGRLMSA